MKTADGIEASGYVRLWVIPHSMQHPFAVSGCIIRHNGRAVMRDDNGVHRVGTKLYFKKDNCISVYKEKLQESIDKLQSRVDSLTRLRDTV